jgi:hypothetical protein
MNVQVFLRATEEGWERTLHPTIEHIRWVDTAALQHLGKPIDLVRLSDFNIVEAHLWIMKIQWPGHT